MITSCFKLMLYFFLLCYITPLLNQKNGKLVLFLQEF